KGNVLLTYSLLNEKSAQLADRLSRNGVTTGTVVALLVERTIEMVIGMIAILKAGGIYLPIDSVYPEERIRYILGDSNAKITLTARSSKKNISRYNEIIYFDEIEQGGKELKERSRTQQPGASIAYIIYTSGSTGRPKGVVVRHRGFVNLVYYHRELFGEGAPDRMSQVASPGFDAMAFEVWPCLLSGAVLYIAGEDIRATPSLLKQWLIDKRITISFQSTMMGEQLLKEKWPKTGTSLRALRVAGDRLRSYPEGPYPFRFYNLYGPTEDTVWTTYTELSTISAAEARSFAYPSIGKPIANHRVYIMDRHLNIQPVGIPGELCIAGDGLALGYLNSPELTALRFLNYTLQATNYKEEIKEKESGSTAFPNNQYPITNNFLYRTGDQARWLPDGNVEFLGRTDMQVKIRGYRIELGEIENSLLELDFVNETVVIDKTGNNEKYLCAYIVKEKKIADENEGTTPDNLTQNDAAQLREHLLKTMPDYMVPAYFVAVDTIPLTHSGKVNRKELPEPQIRKEENYVAPGSHIEKKITAVWADILAIEKDIISMDANFFELGGHSLRATAMIAKLQKELNASLLLVEIFKTPTIKGLAELIKNKKEYVFSSIEPVEKKQYYPMSSSQKRLYLIHQLEPLGTGYNMPQIFPLKKAEREKLEPAFLRLMERHESLRTSFHMHRENPLQKIHAPGDVKFTIEYYERNTVGREKNNFTQNSADRFIRAFDLARPPLFRVGLVGKENGKKDTTSDILMIDMHHIISDAISHAVLEDDFKALLSGENLPPLRIQYKDYTQWQNSNREKVMLLQENYWLKEFEGELPIIHLPSDYPRAMLQRFEGNTIEFFTGKKETETLKRIARKHGITMYMLILAVYNILLTKLSGQEDIIIGTPIAGRRHEDLARIIGIFVNTLALRNAPEARKIFPDFLEEVKEKTLTAFENQDYPFEELVEKVAVIRDTSRNPIFDTMFNYHRVGMKPGKNPQEKVRDRNGQSGPKDDPVYENKTAKFDLTLTGVENAETLTFAFNYCIKIFKKSTIEGFITYFKELIYSITENMEKTIGAIEILPAEEKKQHLFAFNETAEEYPKDKTLHEIFEEQKEKTPDNTAIVGPSIPYKNTISITYKELNKKANKLAALLQEKGIVPGTIVAIMGERSIETMSAILAILKAGAAYLPIEPGYPGERIKYILEDSCARLLITTRTAAKKITLNQESVYLDDEPAPPRSSSMQPIPPRHSEPAYVIYTSGSTGKPKGVLVEHYSVVNLAFSQKKRFEITKNDRILQFSSISFDASVEQIFIALFSGTELHLIDKDTLLNNEKFDRYTAARAITHIHAVPSFLDSMELKSPYKLKRIIAGGDVCTLGLAGKWSKHCDFYNEYGPTETTVTSLELLVKEVEENQLRLPIGKPVGNTTIYLLDKLMNPVPWTVAGELYIGGDGVTRGYLNRVELTHEKFIENPFLEQQRLYRTGDLARRLACGNIEFLGRIDQQVKIRGFRIE
ncbi:MAG: amino acid adenylation domain-containing protein, partial [bacterium]|nr:amino acid adenylation domain-containing protein [bacterium]